MILTAENGKKYLIEEEKHSTNEYGHQLHLIISLEDEEEIELFKKYSKIFKEKFFKSYNEYYDKKKGYKKIIRVECNKITETEIQFQHCYYDPEFHEMVFHGEKIKIDREIFENENIKSFEELLKEKAKKETIAKKEKELRELKEKISKTEKELKNLKK